MNPFAQLLRGILFVILALAGFAMAVILMVSTAIALAVLYVVARVRGRPFAPAAYWQARRGSMSGMQWQFRQGRWSQPSNDPGGADPTTSSASSPRPGKRQIRQDEIIDVEARDIR